jgi:threonine dehydratase
VPPQEMSQWQEFLDTLGYQWWEETHNPAYALFLK